MLKRTPDDLQGYSYDEATVARVDQFVRDVAEHWGRPDAIEHARALYGDTYMYYFFFGTVPGGAHRTQEGGRALGGMGHE